MNLEILSGEYSVCRLDPESPIPDWAMQGNIYSVTRTDQEVSILARSEQVPIGVKQETRWRMIRVEGPLDFNEIGILSGLLQPLSQAEIPVFVQSTYITDYLLIKEKTLAEATAVLQKAGHTFLGNLPEGI